MAKYSIDDTTMTGLANSARALTGGTAGLTPSGIKSVMDTEKLNVAAALAAIAEKGVTVDSGSNSDDLATLIAAIEAGGGDGGSNADFSGDYLGITQLKTGSITPASNAWAMYQKIYHGLSTPPKIVIIYKTPDEDGQPHASYNVVTFAFQLNSNTEVLTTSNWNTSTAYGKFAAFGAGSAVNSSNKSTNANVTGSYVYGDGTFSPVGTYNNNKQFDYRSDSKGQYFVFNATSGSVAGGNTLLKEGTTYYWIVMG